MSLIQVLDDNFTETNLNTTYWLLNSMQYWVNPGWWSGNNSQAIYDPTNNRIILRQTNGNNVTGSATLFGFNLGSSFNLSVDVTNTAGAIFALLFNGTSGTQYYIWSDGTQWQLMINGNGEPSLISTVTTGKLIVDLENGTLTVSIGDAIIYTRACSDSIADGLTFIGGDGYSPSTPIYISSVQLSIEGTPTTPVTSFTESINGLSVACQDTSINYPTSWLWDFGDGNTSTEQYPTHIYNAPGTYTVTLTATNSAGTSTPVTTSITIANAPIILSEFISNQYPTEDEISVYGLIGDNLYWLTNWDNSMIGHLYMTNISTNVTTLLKTGNKLASWGCIVIGNTIYTVGEEQNPSPDLQSTIQIIEDNGTSPPTIITVHMPNTNDCNELVSVDTDGTYLIVGERTGSPQQTYSSYPTGSGLWKIPIATITDTTTWERIWQDPDLYQLSDIAYFQGNWYIHLNDWTETGKWRVVKITDLNNITGTLTVPLDFTTPTNPFTNSPSPFTQQGSMFHAGDNLVVLDIDMNATPQTFAMWVYNGTTWTKTSLMAVPNLLNQYIIRGYWDAINEKIVFMVSSFTSSSTFSIYSINSDGTNLTTLSTGNPGVILTLTGNQGNNTQFPDENVPIGICHMPSETSEVTLFKLISQAITPVANFTEQINDLTVEFTDTSTNTPTTWLWSFGDGNTSTEQNPTHIYAAAGNYQVTLTATNSAGSSTPAIQSVTVINFTITVTHANIVPSNPTTDQRVNGTDWDNEHVVTIQFNEPSEPPIIKRGKSQNGNNQQPNI
jgi:PKD repeat protein